MTTNQRGGRGRPPKPQGTTGIKTMVYMAPDVRAAWDKQQNKSEWINKIVRGWIEASK